MKQYKGGMNMAELQSAAGTPDRLGMGREGEELAANYLKALGYQIYFRNFRCRFGELDIVARRSRELVFVEVKTRSGDLFGTPGEAVDARKQRHMTQAGAFFLQRFGLQHMDVRFDVIEVRIHHFPGI